MRKKLLKQHKFKAVVAFVLMAAMMCFVLPFEAFAADEAAGRNLKERHVWFTYGYTECTGAEHPVSEGNISCYNSDDSEYPKYYGAQMMLCDTGHRIHVEGDGVTDRNITLVSSKPDTLDVDSEGNVTLMKSGTARITAIVAADSTYAESTVYLDVKVDRHEGWIESSPHFVDRPVAWGLELDTSDGPHQLDINLRPGAKASYYSENTKVASVDQSGMLTPLAAGTTQIIVSIDDGGGRYKACRFGWTVKVSGESPQQQLTERNISFLYGYTECTGEEHQASAEDIGYYESSQSAFLKYYSVQMMLCDTGHRIYVVGDGVTAGNVTFVSSDPDVLQIDREGNVTLNKTGAARITATVAADSTYAESNVDLEVKVDQHDGWIGTDIVHYVGRSPSAGLDLDLSDGPQQLAVSLRSGARVSYSVEDPYVVSIDDNGVLTPLTPGTTQIRFDVDGGDRYKSGFFYKQIRVTGEKPRIQQKISGDCGPFTIDWHDGLQLDLNAETRLEYSVTTGKDIASVNQNGRVTFNGTGTAVINVKAAESSEYMPDTVTVSITARDYAAEQAAEEAAREAAALKAEITKAKSLKRPVLTVKALKGRRIKLSWNKVANTDGYIVYVKIPGKKKYVKAVTRGKTVKSVTHKGLTKGRIYYYKIRAYKKVNGKTYYSPYSKAKKARVR